MKCCINADNKINPKYYPRNIRDIIEDLPADACKINKLILWLENNFNDSIGRKSLILKLTDKNIKLKNFHYRYSFLNNTMYFYIRIYDKIDNTHSNISFYVPAVTS